MCSCSTRCWSTSPCRSDSRCSGWPERSSSRDGAIVVCETPNRLIYFDHHTAPDAVLPSPARRAGAEYYPQLEPQRTSADAIELEAAERGPEAALEAIVRWGRGVSFHEFELVFGDLGRHVIASNYDPVLFAERPVQPEEAILSRYLERWRPTSRPCGRVTGWT